MVIDPPRSTDEMPRHLCLNKGYDYAQVRGLVVDWEYTAHIRTRGEETQEKRKIPATVYGAGVLSAPWLPDTKSREVREQA